MSRKKSFFEKLTGAINTNDFDENFDLEEEKSVSKGLPKASKSMEPVSVQKETKTVKVKPEGEEEANPDENWMEEESEEGQLTVDVYQTPEELIIQTMVAGVKPDTLDIQISRDMVTIKGERRDTKVVEDEDFFYRELYWGTFSRTILLPSEVEVEEAEATEQHGLLTLRLPKTDKDKRAKIKVKSSR